MQMNFSTEIVITITQYFYIWNIYAKYLNDVTNKVFLLVG